MHESNARVTAFMIFGGWKGELSIEGDVMTITSPDRTKSLVIDLSKVKRASFNSLNGLWAMRLENGKRVTFQTAGMVLSADRTGAGKIANEKIRALLAIHGAWQLRI